MNLLSLAVIAVAVVQPPRQFDLECTGAPPESGNETRRSFRLDLDAGQYCTNDCRSVEHLLEVTAGKIVLDDRDKSGFVLGAGGERKWLDRVGGVYHDTIMIRGQTFDHVMRCEIRPFTGFPGTKF